MRRTDLGSGDDQRTKVERIGPRPRALAARRGAACGSLGAAIAGALLAALAAACSVTPERPPNFVVLLCDNLGYGDTEPFGSELHRTPHLNRMAREGRKLTHFYASAGVCTPSRASFMTGCYAQRVGLHYTPRDQHVLRPVSPYGLSAEELTIAEVLRDRGYATTLIGKWHLGDQPAFLPTRHGFDSYFGIPYSDDMTQQRGRNSGRAEWAGWPPLPLMDGERVIEAPVDRNLLTRRYTERALDFIDQNRDRPFFLLLSHAMPGSERVPFASDRFRGRSRNGLWGDAVEELDWSAGQILDRLVARGLDERTFVLWTSDNGAPLAREEGSLARGSNLPLFGRGYTTAEGGFRVPAIAWWPGTITGATVSDELMSLIDMLPTLASLAGASVPQDRVIDGLDVSSAILGRDGGLSPRRELLYYHQDELHAVRAGRWKLFLPLQSPSARHPHFSADDSGRSLLFDLTGDPSSGRDVAGDRPEVVRELTAIAERARAELGDRGVPGSGQRAVGIVENPRPATLER